MQVVRSKKSVQLTQCLWAYVAVRDLSPGMSLNLFVIPFVLIDPVDDFLYLALDEVLGVCLVLVLRLGVVE